MSFTIIGNELVLQNTNFNSSYEKLVFIILLRYCNKGIAYPSINKIATLALISRPTVIKALKGLEESNKITKKQMMSNGEYKNNVYTINPEFLDKEHHEYYIIDDDYE
ncbi:helix-turn-helix domain-containing protein [Clostridium botulinum]|uniref:helix-turn-helix domain-containing protein n=1 Tax=Clostridium botulinum TaxID=1491 RepID=UPI000505142C|nr:helix-turn-helix domain-containing protein [Clostridium botulinum]KFX55797.1 hypothetical protein KU41_15320 [Clostridium botulinum]MBN1042543.1 helix-turn-helix domain-containing protein [Clostridium botulinum]MBY6802801.1 helix-turn-helix domain-containing protein [Clostridium botulinum]MBY6812920.1 helix-turn-helix domain-containing protein [Clostridium botulinum]MBY6818953.1 helix-turn-helix domain-containing protein [Clostridium botulinum]